MKTIRLRGALRRRMPILATAVFAYGLAACDDVADPVSELPDDTLDAVEAEVMNPGAPRPATPAEVAMLESIQVQEEPPQLPATALAASSAQAAASACTIGFADYIGLLILPSQAGHTFASAPYYIQGCGSGWVHVKENEVARYGPSFGSGYAHYHLMYEKGPYCVPSGGSYGYKVGSSCINVPNPATEPRYLASHTLDQWVRIYVYKSGVPEMTFDLNGIRVRPNQPIRLWFRKANGAWYVWQNLGVGTWNTSAYSTGIREVLIRGALNAAGSYSFDDVKVAVN